MVLTKLNKQVLSFNKEGFQLPVSSQCHEMVEMHIYFHVSLNKFIMTMDNFYNIIYKYSLLMHCIKIKSRAKSLSNEQYVFVGGNISFLCVLSCISEEA